mmetsp:Transcript_30765/g.89849  ORF Transcript_30765/g.89849 Transcript_30765/m.89849 type:complete len:917 (-) Transcript_30765:979-3729(-)
MNKIMKSSLRIRSIEDIPAVLLDAGAFVHRVGVDDGVVLGGGGEYAHAGKVPLLRIRGADTGDRIGTGKNGGLPLGSALPLADEGTPNFEGNKLNGLGGLVKVQNKVVRGRRLGILLGFDRAIVIVRLLRIAVHGRDPLLPQRWALGSCRLGLLPSLGLGCCSQLRQRWSIAPGPRRFASSSYRIDQLGRGLDGQPWVVQLSMFKVGRKATIADGSDRTTCLLTARSIHRWLLLRPLLAGRSLGRCRSSGRLGTDGRRKGSRWHWTPRMRRLFPTDAAPEIHNLGFLVHKGIRKSVQERYLAHRPTALDAVMAGSIGVHLGPIDLERHHVRRAAVPLIDALGRLLGVCPVTVSNQGSTGEGRWRPCQRSRRRCFRCRLLFLWLGTFGASSGTGLGRTGCTGHTGRLSSLLAILGNGPDADKAEPLVKGPRGIGGLQHDVVVAIPPADVVQRHPHQILAAAQRTDETDLGNRGPHHAAVVGIARSGLGLQLGRERSVQVHPDHAGTGGRLGDGAAPDAGGGVGGIPLEVVRPGREGGGEDESLEPPARLVPDLIAPDGIVNVDPIADVIARQGLERGLGLALVLAAVLALALAVRLGTGAGARRSTRGCRRGGTGPGTTASTTTLPLQSHLFLLMFAQNGAVAHRRHLVDAVVPLGAGGGHPNDALVGQKGGTGGGGGGRGCGCRCRLLARRRRRRRWGGMRAEGKVLARPASIGGCCCSSSFSAVCRRRLLVVPVFLLVFVLAVTITITITIRRVRISAEQCRRRRLGLGLGLQLLLLLGPPLLLHPGLLLQPPDPGAHPARPGHVGCHRDAVLYLHVVPVLADLGHVLEPPSVGAEVVPIEPPASLLGVAVGIVVSRTADDDEGPTRPDVGSSLGGDEAGMVGVREGIGVRGLVGGEVGTGPVGLGSRGRGGGGG